MAEEQEHPRDPSGPTGRNLEPFLLLALLRGPSWGYDLARQLSAMGFRLGADEAGVVYKVLRSLQESGCIHSQWETRESGPARRHYEITAEGRSLLARRAHQLKRYRSRVDQLLHEYTELTGDDFSVPIDDVPVEREKTPKSSDEVPAAPALLTSKHGS